MICVILAAGLSRRMGFDKVFTPLGERGAPLQRIARELEAVTDAEGIVVVPPGREDDALRMAPQLRAIVNDKPERGMVHSLRLALPAIPANEDFSVLLGDMPFVTASLVATVTAQLRTSGADVCYPVREDGTPGHPVAFAARVRELALRLPDGDRLHMLRDDLSLRRVALRIDDPGAYSDLDEPAAWSAADA